MKKNVKLKQMTDIPESDGQPHSKKPVSISRSEAVASMTSSQTRLSVSSIKVESSTINAVASGEQVYVDTSYQLAQRCH